MASITGTLIGEWSPRYALRLTMHRTGDTAAVIRRHRVSRHVPPDTVAGVQWDAEAVRIQWDSYHSGARLDWIPGAEEWIRATVTGLEDQ